MRRLRATVAALSLIPLSQVLVPAASSAAVLGVFHRPIDVRGVHNDVVSSTNWSGYAVEAPSQFTEASGSWTQPAASCSRSGQTYASFWVGLDGYSSNSVEQLGTDSDCRSGHPSYYAWWEMYPAGSNSLSTRSYPVQAGDTLTATVTRSATSYSLSLRSSRGWTFTTTQTGSYANASAEWVAESPELCNYFYCTLASLTNFGTINFTGSQAADGGAPAPISSFTTDSGPHEMTMVTTSGATRAQPGALGSTGTSFSDTWRHS